MDIAAALLPRTATFAAYRDCLRGQSVVVCGCGESAALLQDAARFTTIGVNDIGRLFDPTYLVVVNPRAQFRSDRFRHVERSRAKALFTHLDLGRVDPPVVRFPLGTFAGTDLDAHALHYTQNSPYVAACLAAYMGAARIGLLGVDFTDHHFFARTGRHPLAGRLAQIDREYGALAEALRARGVALENLSPASRLQSLPRASLAEFASGEAARPVARPARRVFVANYRFLSCGEVFADGLRHAAEQLGVEHAAARWDDPRLPEKVAAFAPDLLLVVHGRRFAQRWGARFARWRTAVWLTDEPYEVDDTASWSSRFDLVFANDPATLDRHGHAHYVPMAYDPQVYRPGEGARAYRVGFIGGGNPNRERCLAALADAGLLGYVVGGPWRSPALQRLCLAANVPALRTAELYRQTEVVVNVFREKHHFNARGVAAHAMNPRIYEALACGAAVVSERRAEIAQVFPELPQFDGPDDLVRQVRHLLDDRSGLADLRAACTARLAGHSYGDRLARMLEIASAGAAAPAPAPARLPPAAVVAPQPARPPAARTVASPPRRAARLEPMPFDAPPRRNLLYHVWPVRGPTWRWNLDELLQRVDLFNGRRIVGIACDERTDPPEAVQEHLAGHGFEFVVVANDASGEGATFAAMMERVASTERNELTFYAHAKGVKYEPQAPPAVRRWAEVQYAVTLDDWVRVREDLVRHAMTGLFRRHGRFRNHESVGAWHYSGTFFWMRHAHVFRRHWREVPRFYGGVEAWPGTLFAAEETGCLLMDQLRDLPYRDAFWKQRGEPAFRQWKAGMRSVPVPAGLAAPAPFEGHAWPRLEQKPQEFAWWLDRLLREDVRELLVVGAGWGGEEWHMARRFREAGRTLSITTLAPEARREWHEAAQDARARFGQQLVLATQACGVPQRVDAAFVDGEHGYRACRGDVALATSRGARLVGLHDIVDSDWHAQNRCCVSRVWAELRAAGGTEELASGEWGGMGIARVLP
ncbi:glycosyltransferase [Ramlibacter sp. USB13]|uniref:Glycosyltransferase n=1 Tax=Ramlibacter cellulosilyticus TaxID=2764187 RepID=A0A923MR52_9BURK|nr:glycosyltransferase [Ramlibacter cellulosilyticus]MBC5783441.1 glycosyltransferase [Ramlibacter cellulosilyticus]